MGKIVNQAEFKREEILEQQFKDRYGRDCEVYRSVTLGEDNILNHVTVHVVFDDDKYTITEYLKKDQTTDYVLSGKDGEPRKYRDYLSAEVFVADLIGEKIRNKGKIK